MDLTRSGLGKMSAKNVPIEYICISHVAGVDPCTVHNILGQNKNPSLQNLSNKDMFERTASVSVSVCRHVNHVGARIFGGGPAALARSETWTLSSCKIPGLRCFRFLFNFSSSSSNSVILGCCGWTKHRTNLCLSGAPIPSACRLGAGDGWWFPVFVDMTGPCDLSTWSRAMELYDGHSARGVADAKDETTK